MDDRVEEYKQKIIDNFEDFFEAYFKEIFKISESQEAIYNWHIAKMGEQIRNVIAGDNTKCIWNLPPFSSKTTIGICLSTLYIAFHSNTRIVIVSGTDKVRDKYLANTRNIITSDFYKALFPWVYINEEKPNNKDGYSVNEFGSFIIKSIASNNTGMDADMVIVDDPVDYGLYKERGMKYIMDVNDKVFYLRDSRLRETTEQKKPFILIMQRMCQGDPSDYLINVFHSDNWQHLCIPALEDSKEDCFRGRQGKFYYIYGKSIFREFGSVLCSKIKTKEYIEEKKLTFSGGKIVDFNYQYQQHNDDMETSIFSLACIRYYQEDKDRKYKFKILSLDTANGLTNGDFNATSLWGLDEDNNIYLLDLWIDRYKLDQLEIQTCNIIDTEMPKFILIESASTGISLINRCEKKIYGKALENDDPRKNTMVVKIKHNSTDKETRCLIANSLISRGLVYFPEKDIDRFVKHETKPISVMSELKQEMLIFPKESVHDDAVDSLSQALEFIKQRYIDNNNVKRKLKIFTLI